jgi:hypothetical protein
VKGAVITQPVRLESPTGRGNLGRLSDGLTAEIAHEPALAGVNSWRYLTHRTPFGQLFTASPRGPERR